MKNSVGFAGNTRSHLKERTLLFRYLALINLILGAWYLEWRITNSINFNALWLAVPLGLAEIYGYIGGLIFIVGLWRPLVRQVKSLDRMTPHLAVSDWPIVDVFITCYEESPEMVESTARAALAIDYPVTKLRVYVLDDGNSPAMREMAQRLCIEDLQSPLLQQEAHRLEVARSQKVLELQEIEDLIPEIEVSEQALQDLCYKGAEIFDEPEGKFLQRLQQFILFLNPEYTSVSSFLTTQRHLVETAIHQKELELSELARCRYIARPKPAGKPHHAKAGNINYAIFSGETSGEFILTLDADHIPKPPFLKRILPYFYTYNVFSGKYEKNGIAFVQTPQNFCNIPPDDPFGHKTDLFYGLIQQGKDGLNSALYTGTNAVLRREALVSVGLQYFSEDFYRDKNRLDEFELLRGVFSNSITEDMNTAMRLHGAGWKSIYHNEVLAEGLATDDLSSTLKQRLRLAQGTIRVLDRENPLTKQGLSFWQRLQYFQLIYSYFSGFTAIILIACPIIYLFTGIIPVSAIGYDFAIHFFPAFILNRLTFLVAVWGIPAKSIWRAEQDSIALFPLFIQAVWSVLAKQRIKFQVTPNQRQARIYLRLVWPQLAVFILTIIGILWGFVRFGLHQPIIYLVNVSWSIYNLVLLWAIIRAAIWQPKTGAEIAE
jgi:cellulose synthase (UDP-forming)